MMIQPDIKEAPEALAGQPTYQQPANNQTISLREQNTVPQIV